MNPSSIPSTPETAPSEQQLIAALDLGSNSFHMVIGRASGGDFAIVDRLRESVRIGAGLDENKRLDKKTVERALACLERFQERLQGLPRANLRAVGTQTFRAAKNADELLHRARKILGVPIEILPGPEEARLIYLGVAHDLADDTRSRLVIDIGGGSTECTIGKRFESLRADSFPIGCVSYSRRFFPGGEITRKSFKRAELAARLELETIQEAYSPKHWEDCVGASGTIKSVARILRSAGWSLGGIDLEGLRRLRREMIAIGSVDKLGFAGMQPDRAPVLPGGLAILKAVFQTLKIERMRASSAALREGLLYDLLGRIRHEDVRDRTIEALSRRYDVDRAQASRVEATAIQLLGQVPSSWEIDTEPAERLLSWCARLHETGLAIAYSGFHKHGEYILLHADMPGFSRDNQRLLATLVRAHRRSLSHEIFETLPPFQRNLALRLTLLMRLAVRLNRNRSPEPLPQIELRAKRSKIEVRFPPHWLSDHPLTRADLDEEAGFFSSIGIELTAS